MDPAVGLPAGFTLDAPAAAGAGDAGLPQGFKLDAPAALAAYEPRRFKPDRGEDGSSLDFITGNVNKGIAGVAGLPVDFARNLINLGIAAYGFGTGKGADAPEPLAPGPGSGASFEQMMRKGGAITEASDPSSKGGEYAASALQMLPGAAMGRPTNAVQAARAGGAAATGGAAGQAGADIGGEEWRGVAAMVPGAAKVQQKTPGERGTAARQAEDFGKAKDMGIPVPPRMMKADRPQQSLQDTINAELRQPPGTEISPKVLQTYRNAYWADYENLINAPQLARGLQPNRKFRDAIRDISDEATAASAQFPQTFRSMGGVTKLLADYQQGISMPPQQVVRAIRKLRSDATTNLTSDKPEQLEIGRAQRKIAMSLENLIEDNLGASGNQALLARYRDARTAIAKSHDVESSLDPVTRKVSGAKLSQLLTEGRPLSGGLQQAAEVSGAFPGAMKTVPEGDMFAKRMSPFGMTHPGSVIAHAGTRLLDPIQLSRPYQSMFVDPRNKLTPEQERGLRYMMAAMQGGRQDQIPTPP